MSDEPEVAKPELPPQATSSFELMFAAPPRPESRTLPGESAPAPVPSVAPAVAPPPDYFSTVPVFDGPTLSEGQSVSDIPSAFGSPPVFSAPPTAPTPTPAATSAPFPSAAVIPTQSFVAFQSQADTTSTALPGDFTFERRSRERQRASSSLDWIAFVLAFILPPIGLLAGIAALVVSTRSRGWTSGIGRAAAGIGVAFTLVLVGGGLLISRNLGETAAHDAVVSSSVEWCASLKSDPGRLSSATYGWPAIGATITESIPAMQKYEDVWTGLAKIAPDGIKGETQKIATTAAGIITSVQTSRVLDDASNVAQMQRVVGASTIPAWVSDYCN